MKDLSVCLFGTSNGVFENGYASSIRDFPRVGNFKNLSLGYSTSSLFCMRSNEVDVGSFDICVIDYAVNDAVTLATGAQDAHAIEVALEDCVRAVLSAGSVPAILIFPVLNLYLNGDRRISDIYRNISQKYALPYFDCYQYIRFIEKNYSSIEKLFEDNMHLNRDVAKSFGSIFINNLIDYCDVETESGVSLVGDGQKYNFLPVSDLG